MYAKLFSRIAQSSLMEEDIETRYCFMMLLAIADSGGDVIGTDVALARTVNLPLDTFKRCIVALMAPDPDSNSQVNEGRRIMPSESGRGYLLVNYATYRSIKTAEEKKAYMREYMQRRRKLLKDKDVTAVNVCKTSLSDVTHAEGEGEADGESEVKAEAFQPEQPPTASAKPKGVVEGKNSDRLPLSDQSKRFAAIMGRRLTTEWSEDECAAYRKLGTVAEPDLDLVERFYTEAKGKPDAYLRTSLLTFVRHFRGEIDKARAWFAALPQPKTASYYLPGVGMVNAK